MPDRDSGPPRRHRLVGRALNVLVARAPVLWPLVRAPMRRFFGSLAQGWDERTGAGSPEHLAAFAAAATHVGEAPERALDIGCGTGEATLFLAREFPAARVRGIDFSEEMVQIAQAKVGLDPEGRIAFKAADASDLPYDEDSFDLVAQLNMPPFFAEMARVLRPGGYAIVAASWGERTPFYTPPSVLERGFRKHGLEPVMAGEAGPGSYFVARRPT
ncbi:MAG TPA: class I SAM-dependent methyltransferase [Solirubrobacterales bacterium]